MDRTEKTKARNAKIQQRFNEIYNVRRKRLEDALQQLADEFFLEISTIRRILSAK